MFDFVYRNKRLVQIVLGLLVLPFAFVGVDSYVRNMGSDNDVATVGGTSITPQEYDNAVRQQQQRMSQMLGKNFDPAMFDNPEVKQQVLDGVINQRLLQTVGQNLKLTAPDAQLRKVILEVPDFQESGKFSESRYDELLRANGLTRVSYESRLRGDLAQQPLQDALARSSFSGAAQAAMFQKLTEQAREIQVATIDIASFIAQAKVDDAQVKAEYDKNPDAYRAPEQVKLEYLQLNQAAFAASATASVDEVKAEYDKRVKEFTAPEERRASHILISIDKDDKGQAKAGAKDAAKAEAEAIQKQVSTAPEKFADLAKQKSKDPGSAAQGGDLGFFGRGQMVKPFEEAVFSMKPGEIRGPIESDFGFHIIRLAEVKPERARPLDEVRAQLEGEIKQQKTSKLFNENAEKFQNRVYEQGDSYAKLAEELKLEVKKTDWLTRAQVQAIGGGNQKFVQTVFAPANIAAKKNSEAVDLGNNSLISARIVDYKPSSVRPLDEVKAQITAQLQRKLATELASKAGAEKVAAVAAGNDSGLTFGAVQKLLRQAPVANVNQALTKQVFAADLSKGGAVVGGGNDAGGYTVVKVVKVVEPEAPNADKLKSLAQRLSGQSAGDLSNAYVGALKDHIKVEVKKGVAQGGEKDGKAGTDAKKS
ncbi:MAG: SurA N-terminal domain-containing protein [Burkholderiales bacterium]|nr:SurA N-terminal domain-containing protein [Burkholderiales bacterium]